MLAIISKELGTIETEILVVPVCKDTAIHEQPKISAVVKKAADFEEFKGARDEEMILYHPTEFAATRVMLIGLGDSAEVDRETLRLSAGGVVNRCLAKNLPEVVFLVPSHKHLKMETASVLESLMEGAYLGNHRFYKYKKPKKQERKILLPDALTLLDI